MEHDMYDNHAGGNEHRGGRRAGLRRAGLLAAALACLALVAAACSSAASPGTGAGGSAKHSELAYSRCMRAHGIKDFPDPNAHGELAVDAGPGTGLDPKSPQFKAANSACKSLLPPRRTLTPAQQAEARAQGLRYSRCMRAHGISDFPDPDNQGGIALQPKPGSDLNPNNPQFQAASKACQQEQSGGTGGSFSTNTSGSPGGGS